MSSFSAKLNPERPYRYVFEGKLWERSEGKYSDPFNVMLDTGTFNTIVHKGLVEAHGVMLKRTMKVKIGGYVGDANLCILDKLQIGGHVLAQVFALAVSFDGELKDHILLGANVINNWKLTLSRFDNTLDVTEQFSGDASKRIHPYRSFFDNKGCIVAFHELDLQEHC